MSVKLNFHYNTTEINSERITLTDGSATIFDNTPIYNKCNQKIGNATFNNRWK